MNSCESFSADFRSARAKFLALSTAVGAQLRSYEYPEIGADGDPIYTDVARLGPADAPRLLVLISGMHGVEGFCGSGAQVDLLRRGEERNLADGTSLLLVHAINPFGFSWLRRTTHENVDLNRNWVDFERPLPDNPGYRRMAARLCPRQWSDETKLDGRRALQEIAQTDGPAAAKQALAGGQYEFPDGIYYGGRAPTWSRKTLTRILAEETAARDVAIIDFHTGIGPWGLAELIMTSAPGSPAFARASQWFGNNVRSTVDGSSTAAQIGGDAMSASHAILKGARVTPIVVEVGTLPREEVVDANRADNWLHAHGDLGAPYSRAIKREIRDAYYGDQPDWKGMVAGQSLQLFRQALRGLEMEGDAR